MSRLNGHYASAFAFALTSPKHNRHRTAPKRHPITMSLTKRSAAEVSVRPHDPKTGRSARTPPPTFLFLPMHFSKNPTDIAVVPPLNPKPCGADRRPSRGCDPCPRRVEGSKSEGRCRQRLPSPSVWLYTQRPIPVSTALPDKPCGRFPSVGRVLRGCLRWGAAPRFQAPDPQGESSPPQGLAAGSPGLLARDIPNRRRPNRRRRLLAGPNVTARAIFSTPLSDCPRAQALPHPPAACRSVSCPSSRPSLPAPFGTPETMAECAFPVPSVARNLR